MDKPTQQEMFDYLVELRDSCVTNMWGAAPFLEAKFHITALEARKTLIAWFNSFNEK